jgi:hypothetical protein
VEEIDAAPLDLTADLRAERRRSYRITAAGLAAVRAEARRLADLLASDAAQALLTE